MPVEDQADRAAASVMVLFHRHVAFTVSHERRGVREWAVFFPDVPIDDVVRGLARA